MEKGFETPAPLPPTPIKLNTRGGSFTGLALGTFAISVHPTQNIMLIPLLRCAFVLRSSTKFDFVFLSLLTEVAFTTMLIAWPHLGSNQHGQCALLPLPPAVGATHLGLFGTMSHLSWMGGPNCAGEGRKCTPAGLVGHRLGALHLAN